MPFRVAELYWPSHSSEGRDQSVGLEDTVTLLVSLVTGLGVMLILLGVCLVVVCRRHRHRGAPHSPPRNSSPPLIYDPDRVALIADGAQLGEVRFRFLQVFTHLFNSVFASPIMQTKMSSASCSIICIINVLFYMGEKRRHSNTIMYGDRMPRIIFGRGRK